MRMQYDSLLDSLKKAQAQLMHSEKQRDSEREIYTNKVGLFEEEISKLQASKEQQKVSFEQRIQDISKSMD